ncbi:hypothetical protein T03_11212 [Trichinella britovi]|uniref:Uncharacterized protein n=1 Tax=Trichinella britovi TaxID=45882 RepID=A0A0V1BHT6_TRIBR|nr:hypothetical protein T03_11212 [Trichinella britovi]
MDLQRNVLLLNVETGHSINCNHPLIYIDLRECGSANESSTGYGPSTLPLSNCDIS